VDARKWITKKEQLQPLLLSVQLALLHHATKTSGHSVLVQLAGLPNINRSERWNFSRRYRFAMCIAVLCLVGCAITLYFLYQFINELHMSWARILNPHNRPLGDNPFGFVANTA